VSFLEADGMPRLRYRDEGRGPAVLLVHGWLLDSTMFDSLAQSLARRRRVVRWDRRGCGESGGTPSLAADGADGLRLLRELGIARCAVLGSSQGCRVALAIVESAPQQAACLVLDGAPPVEGLADRGWQDETPLAAYRSLLAERGIEALRSELAQHPLLQLAATTDATAPARRAAALARYGGADLAGPPANAVPAAPGRLARLELPVLVLNGEFDTPQRLRIGAALVEQIDGAERRIVARARHLACWDNPDDYNRAVEEFLDAHEQRWAVGPEGAS
jgi:pimeloyl-ACP methyl ester carboxylesterase